MPQKSTVVVGCTNSLDALRAKDQNPLKWIGFDRLLSDLLRRGDSENNCYGPFAWQEPRVRLQSEKVTTSGITVTRDGKLVSLCTACNNSHGPLQRSIYVCVLFFHVAVFEKCTKSVLKMYRQCTKSASEVD